jgi:hypothetical protein
MAALIVTPWAAAAEDPDKTRAAAIFARVLSYELTLDQRAGDEVGVVVVYKRGDTASQATADEWLRALNQLSAVKIKNRRFFALKIAYDAVELRSLIQQRGVDVLLASDGLTDEDARGLSELSRAQSVLSAANSPPYVEGNMTLCVTEKDGKPHIIINLRAAKLEGIRFSSSLLQLARIIR